jgi:N-acyl-D-aspartate/D-glutamate deacylase
MTGRLLLCGGLVADGVGVTTRRADVLIEGDVVASLTGPGTAGGVRDWGEVIDLAPVMAADICVIGPRGMTDRASGQAPRAAAAGVHLVLVNGVIAWRDGQPVTARFPGRFVS